MKPIIFYYQIALGAFLALVYAAFYVAEKKHPWRAWREQQWERLKRHVGLFVISRWAIWLVFPSLTLGFAWLLQDNPMGLLYQTDWPKSLQIFMGVLALDVVMYVQHRALHFVPWLWRVHRVHHVDTAVDASTGLRFHPLEALFTAGSKILGVGFFGILPLSVIIYEVLLGAALFFAHMNVKIPIESDLELRRFIVTPHMHLIHHSDETNEHNKNYSFCFSFWDRLFGSYKQYSATGNDKVVLGLSAYRDPKFQTFRSLLYLPFNIPSLKIRPRKMPISRMRADTPPSK